MAAFRWRSKLLVSVALFLVMGFVFNFVPAILVPLSLHTGGVNNPLGLIVGNAPDSAVLGRSLADIAKSDRGLNAFLVSFMDTMCAMMMGYAIGLIALAWFALRRRERWAFWTSVVANLAPLPYFGIIGLTYTSFGVSPWADLAIFFVLIIGVLVVATVLGWQALGGPRRSAVSAPVV